jgi:putative endonuclease
LPRRAYQHRTGAIEGFTKRYRLRLLVWFERHEDIVEAIAREKTLKRWQRAWKFELIEALNPNWDDLYARIV